MLDWNASLGASSMSRLRTAWIFIDLPFPCEISLATQRNSKKSTVPESSMSTSNMASCKQKLIVCSFYEVMDFAIYYISSEPLQEY